LIEDIINKVILLQALNYNAYFKFNKKKGGMLCVREDGKVVWIYPYVTAPQESHARTVLTNYFGESIIRN
tara:strand:+ start:610 stop:819 length:210 start_codon:yes stop_codon:yes gene_type:complete